MTPSKASTTPDQTPDAMLTPEAPAGGGDTITYGEAVKVDGGFRVTAHDEHGNAMTADAESEAKARSALRTALRALRGLK